MKLTNVTNVCPRCECVTYNGKPGHCGACGFVIAEGCCYYCGCGTFPADTAAVKQVQP